MNKSNWKDEKLKYTRCSALNTPAVNTRLFYKIAHTIRDRHLAPCTLKEVDGDEFIVQILEGCEQGTMKAPIKDFFLLNEC
jgi:hypothetical protein